MKLLEAINMVELDNERMIERITEALKDRAEDIRDKEPLDYGYSHEKWDEKLCDLESIIERLENLNHIRGVSKRKLELKQIIVDIKVHQFMYKGLKRLVI